MLGSRAALLRRGIQSAQEYAGDSLLDELSEYSKVQAAEADAEVDYELAELELKRFLTLQRAKQRVRALFKFRRPRGQGWESSEG